jgi:RNA polymerase sigma-70 factor (ECF subfamily)
MILAVSRSLNGHAVLYRRLSATDALPMNNDEKLGDENAEVDLSKLTDKSLLRRYKVGEQDAATALYLRYAERLQRLANLQSGADVALRVDPEGIVQSVFRTFFRRVAKGQYDVLEGEDLWKLFLVIALNKVRSTASLHRTAKRDVSKTVSFGGNSDAAASVGDDVALSILKMTIDETLANFPADCHPVIQMRIEGHQVDDIARQTKRSKRSVERILQQFKSHLQRTLKNVEQ